MPTIILSYRRDDTGWIAGRVFDRLVQHYGADQVFMDIDSIPFGLDFREHIQTTLKGCDILLAVVGPRWANPEGKQRLNEETDWVRIEIETALAKKIPVIPVLIDGTALPRPVDLPEGLRDLAFRQAAPLDTQRDFHPHMDRLIKAMDALIEGRDKNEKKQEETPRRRTKDETKIPLPTPSGDTPKKVEPKPKPKPKDEKTSAEAAARSTLWQATTSPSGRMSRSAFWTIMIASYLAMYVAAVGIAILWANATSSAGDPNPAMLVALLWLWVPFAAGSKRLHDTDRSGGLVLLPMSIGAFLAMVLRLIGLASVSLTWWLFVGAGAVGLTVLVALGFLTGTKGPNRYGPGPLDRKTGT